MNLQTRKLNFIQEFLRLSNEEVIGKLEKLLQQEKKKKYKLDLKPMTVNDFNEMIDKAEEDVKQGRVMEAKELKKAVKKWK